MNNLRKWLKNELVMALGINLLFLIIYVCFFQPIYETNDDNAMAFFVEGAYGNRTSRLVFENLIWGKLLSIMSGLIPGVKWYTVGQYIMIFFAFVSVTYIMLRLQGKRIGVVSSVFLLGVFGCNTYVIFQFTRTAAITTIGGMLLLFFAIEYAERRHERVIALIVGACLCIFGSMIRFEFFAIGVVLIAGIGLFRLVEMLREKKAEWKRKLGRYFLVFGVVGILSTGLKVADNAYYMKDEEWNYYLEYNDLRGKLWDLGFPNYNQNKALYESLGISINDFEYYRTWNMDQELLPLDTLRALVDAKEKTELSLELVKKYFSLYPMYFLSIPMFGWFVIASLITVVVNKKNLLLVLYEFLAIMAFEFYFFYIRRAGLSRIDTGMWMAAIAALMYGMSEEIGRLRVKSRKWTVILSGVILALNLPTFTVNMVHQSSVNSKIFFQTLAEDKDGCYLLPVKLAPYKILDNAYGFWEPSQLGDASNIYYLGGWEYNMPIKNEMLRRHGLTNVYRDSVDNPNIFIVANDEVSLIERYIQENYDAETGAILVKSIEGVGVWRVRDKALILNGKINPDLSEIVSDINIDIVDGDLNVSGYCYKKDSNSFQQYAYLKLENNESGETSYLDLTLSNLEGNEDVMNGKYSSVSGRVKIDVERKYNVSVILEADGELYEIKNLEK